MSETQTKEAVIDGPKTQYVSVRRVLGGYVVGWDLTREAVCTDLFEVKAMLDRIFSDKD